MSPIAVAKVTYIRPIELQRVLESIISHSIHSVQVVVFDDYLNWEPILRLKSFFSFEKCMVARGILCGTQLLSYRPCFNNR